MLKSIITFILGIVLFSIMVLTLNNLYIEKQDCDKIKGVLVRSFSGWICVKEFTK